MSRDPMLDGRIRHVRDICQRSIENDRDAYPDLPNALTNRAWLAQSVINILDGLIDAQIVDEITREAADE